MTLAHPYTVPIIAGDLRRAEFVKQLADTCEYVDSVSQDLFDRIALRLNVYRAQLNKLEKHIQHTNVHIDQIKGSKQATQVYSSSRYLAEQKRSTYKSIFEQETINDDNRSPELYWNAFRLNETTDKFINPNDKESKMNDETLVVLKSYEDDFIQKIKKVPSYGLGKPPANIKSVVSFLKCNTQENPYIRSTNIDPLSCGSRKRKLIDEPVQSRIEETRLPVFYSQMPKRQIVDDFGYTPISNFVPQLSLPDNLPELDDFATFDDNTTNDWQRQHMASIAPSSAISMLSNIQDLTASASTNTVNTESVIVTALPADIQVVTPIISTPVFVSPPIQLPPSSVPPLFSSVATLVEETDAVVDNKIDDDSGDNPQPVSIGDAVNIMPVDEDTLPNSQEQKSIEHMLAEVFKQRRLLIAGQPASSMRRTPAATAARRPAITSPPSTGDTFVDAIAEKAREVAAAQQHHTDDSDNDDSNDSDWEP